MRQQARPASRGPARPVRATTRSPATRECSAPAPHAPVTTPSRATRACLDPVELPAPRTSRAPAHPAPAPRVRVDPARRRDRRPSASVPVAPVAVSVPVAQELARVEPVADSVPVEHRPVHPDRTSAPTAPRAAAVVVVDPAVNRWSLRSRWRQEQGTQVEAYEARRVRAARSSVARWRQRSPR